MHTIRTNTHHVLDIVLDTLFDVDPLDEACENCSSYDMLAMHLVAHAYLAQCGNTMVESDKGIIRDGVEFSCGILAENVEGIEIDAGAIDALVEELYARLKAYHEYANKGVASESVVTKETTELN